MREQFVTYEIAEKLKQLEFKENCIAIYDREKDFYFVNNPSSPIDNHNFYYNQECLAPLWQQAIDWLYLKGYLVQQQFGGYRLFKSKEDLGWFGTKEEAVLKGIEKITKK